MTALLDFHRSANTILTGREALDITVDAFVAFQFLARKFNLAEVPLKEQFGKYALACAV